MPNSKYEFSSEDFEYLRHGDRALKLRVYRPRGDGPFPAVIDIHGGAWCNGDLNECKARDEVLAASGLVAVGLDFRHAADGYPTSLVDINYAIRWVKANAAKLGVRQNLVGLSGQSSGGHLAMLTAMRPHDTRYSAIPLPAGSPSVDATVTCVAMTWPVINPLSRYRHARRARDTASPPAWVRDIPERHDMYWKTEANMSEGNPMLALERGEKVLTPPALWVQGKPDIVHDYRDPESPIPGNEPERFVANYRKAGGKIELTYIDYETRAGHASHDPVTAFFHQHMKVA
jgi:acetyl esterase